MIKSNPIEPRSIVRELPEGELLAFDMDTVINGGPRRRQLYRPGYFGQTIFIDPKRQLVVAMNGNWENATEAELNKQRFELIDRVRGIIDQQD